MFDFFASENNAGNELINYSYEDLFKAKNIYLSKGLDIPFYKIKEDSEEYENIWKDTKLYISKILKTKSTYEKRIKLDEFNNINSYISSRAFYTKFAFLINTNQLANLLDIEKEINVNINNIDSVIVLPWKNINQNIVTVYLKSGMYLYQFEIEYENLDEKKALYEAYVQKYYESNYLRYNFINEYFPDENPFDFYLNQSLLFSFESGNKKYVNYDEIMMKSTIDIDEEDKEKYIMKISEIILGENTSNYIVHEGRFQSVVMANINNRYEYFKEGILEYKKISDTKTEDNSDVSEYNMVIDVLNNLSQFIDTEKLFLSGLQIVNGKKHFYFDYEHNNTPIYFSFADSNRKKLDHLIEIVVDNGQIVEFTAMLKKISVYNQNMEYSINFFDMLDNIYMKVEDIRVFSIADYRIVYYYQGDEYVIKPKWKVYSNSHDIYIFDILRR